MDNGGGAASSSPAAHIVRANDDDSAKQRKRPPDGWTTTTISWTGTKKHKNNAAAAGCSAAAAPTPSASRKRPYEYGEYELDVAMQKLYKCNYWEDPAYEKRLRFFGLSLAREAAFDNLYVRLERQYEAYMAACAQHLAGASGDDGGDPPRPADYFIG